MAGKHIHQCLKTVVGDFVSWYRYVQVQMFSWIGMRDTDKRNAETYN